MAPPYGNQGCSAGKSRPHREGPRLKQNVFAIDPFKEFFMLRWVVIFLIVALVASVFGFGGVASAATDIAKWIFYFAAAGFVISLVLAVWALRKI
ncbi:DUF1328 domain-containing protein [Thiomonas sp.]|uniref:DUF1328 domain-containing protein n=1 Tax=Thiomonas sp. TaxID=2047785 RepID=UPI0026171E3E|nr:DUF1328 domain-containing protein [Thiomonas sp.]